MFSLVRPVNERSRRLRFLNPTKASSDISFIGLNERSSFLREVNPRKLSLFKNSISLSSSLRDSRPGLEKRKIKAQMSNMNRNK